MGSPVRLALVGAAAAADVREPFPMARLREGLDPRLLERGMGSSGGGAAPGEPALPAVPSGGRERDLLPLPTGRALDALLLGAQAVGTS
eukprot:10093042-Lingulodinium_polyedra.AAC.1